MAANVARDHFKAESSSKRGGKVLAHVEINSENTPGAIDAGTIERSVLLNQIERRVDDLTSNSPRDRTIFWLYYRQGFSSAAIAGIPAFRLTTKGVESILNRLTRSLRREVLKRNFVSPPFSEGMSASSTFPEGEELG
jgi:RNA polymerase sigma-70 factor (ECF subfamily)